MQKWKAYNEKILFAHTIIHDIDTIGIYVVEFLCRNERHWCVREYIEPRTTSIDLIFIEKLKDDKAMEQHFVETQTM